MNIEALGLFVAPWTDSELKVAEHYTQQWIMAGIAAGTFPTDDRSGLNVVVCDVKGDPQLPDKLTQDDLAKGMRPYMIKVQKISYPGFIFRKGRFLSYRVKTFDASDAAFSNYIVQKNQRSLWPMIMADLLGTGNSLPTLEAAILQGNQI